ncbi:MAG: hypothetical protein FJ098_03505, partial [Deltaproteobacteria bacterium]|nr:hypothetical protein [Deltaproteobacteria bacterium]
VCNSKDDDCDGVTDEGFPLKGQPCDGADSDLCQNGTHTCSGNGAGVECVNENPVNIPEVCNNKDDDCNGSVDPENSGNCTSYRRDQDNDTFGDANSPAKCYCAPTGVYKVTSSTDCYDQNGNAHPGQTGWFSTHRGDGSFDYDCSGSAEKRWTAVSGGCELFGDLCSGVPGWSGSAPACGAGGTWRDNCHWVFDWPPCRFDNASRTQQCH